MTTVDPLIVSNNILELAYQDKVVVTPMKLQKLLYFLYRDYLKKTGKSLFSERFETWKYGPVLAKVYHEFSHYKDKNIDEYYKDADGKSYKLNEDIDSYFACVLHNVWGRYKNYSGIELSNITHKDGTAWRKAWNEGSTFLDDKDILEE